MAQVTLAFDVRHNAEQVAAAFEATAEEVTGAMRRGTSNVVKALEREAADTFERRAGGVYWDIDSTVAPTPDGAHGVVRTPRSKPHRIEPTKSHGLLVFEVASGETVFIRGGVNHPGSNPVDWLGPLEAAIGDYERYFTDELRPVFGLGSGGGAFPAGGL